MSTANHIYINNPISGRPIQVGGRIYNRLVRAGVLQPDEYDTPLPTPNPPGRHKKKSQTTSKYVVEEAVEDYGTHNSYSSGVDYDEDELDQSACEENVAQGKPADYGAPNPSYRKGMRYKDAQSRIRYGPEDDIEMLNTLQRVAKCASNSIRGDPQRFENMTEDQIRAILEHLITEGMERDFEEDKGVE